MPRTWHGQRALRRRAWRCWGYSVAERSFSFLDRVQMCVQPMAQPLLGCSRQLQEERRKTQRRKNVKAAPSVHDNMRALGTQLLKGERLARLVGKSRTCLCVGKQMIQTRASHHCEYIK